MLGQMADEISAGDFAAALQSYGRLSTSVQAWPRAQVLLASASLGAGDTGRARDALRAAEARGKMGRSALIEKATLHKALGDAAGHHDTLVRICDTPPVKPKFLYELGASFLQRDDPDAADRIAQRLQASGQRQDLVHRLRYDIALYRLDIPAMKDVFDAILASDAPLPKLPQVFFSLRELPEPDRTRLCQGFWDRFPELRPKMKPWWDMMAPGPKGADAAIDIWADAPDSVPRPARFRRPLIVDDGSAVLTSVPGESGVTLLGFAGLANRFMAPVEWVDAFCAAHNHSAVYLRDTDRTLFQGGVPSLAPDLEGTIDALRGMLSRLNTRRLICLGTSGGGFGAIRYGMRLEAAHILCASPPTSFDVVDSIGDDRARLLVQRMAAQFGKENLDMLADVRAGGGKTRLTIWFGADAREDAAHARHLEGQPGVTLVPVPDFAAHTTFEKILESGAFEDFVAG